MYALTTYIITIYKVFEYQKKCYKKVLASLFLMLVDDYNIYTYIVLDEFEGFACALRMYDRDAIKYYAEMCLSTSQMNGPCIIIICTISIRYWEPIKT